MAAMQREMVIATDEGIAVIKKQVIIDPESGLAVEVENAKIAVDVGGGNVLVQEQQRVRGVHIPSAAMGSGNTGDRRAIQAGNTSNTPIVGGKRDAPPAYSELFPGMRDLRSQVDGARQGEGSAPAPVAVPMTLCDILCKSFVCGFCYLLLAALNISMIVIGSVYLHDCTVQDKIPVFLIVFGCVSLFQTCCGICRVAFCRKNDDEAENRNRCDKSIGCCVTLITVFLFVWFIVGNVWVFSGWNKWVANDRSSCSGGGSNDCCDPALMYFSFSLLLILYGISALVCCCLCCCMCCFILLGGASE